MCYERLVEDDVVETGMRELLWSEWYCAVRNGTLAGLMVLAVLLFEGAPAWLVVASVGGAVALGTVLHQLVLLAGAGLVRARARWLEAVPPSG